MANGFQFQCEFSQVCARVAWEEHVILGVSGAACNASTSRHRSHNGVTVNHGEPSKVVTCGMLYEF